jgi:hypothetical protein
MRYNKALDLILAGALAMRAGEHAKAADFMVKAADEDDFDDATDMMDSTNQEAIDEEDASVKPTAVAAFARAAARLKVKADANDVAPVSTEPLGDGDLPANAQSTESPERQDGEAAVQARLQRATANRRTLARK